MRSKNTIQAAPIAIGNVWLPCEYIESKRLGVHIVSLGDVEHDTPAGKIAYIKRPLRDAAVDVLRRMSDDRKLVVFIPNDRESQDQWPCKQILKKELAPALDEAGAAP